MSNNCEASCAQDIACVRLELQRQVQGMLAKVYDGRARQEYLKLPGAVDSVQRGAKPAQKPKYLQFLVLNTPL